MFPLIGECDDGDQGPPLASVSEGGKLARLPGQQRGEGAVEGEATILRRSPLWAGMCAWCVLRAHSG